MKNVLSITILFLILASYTTALGAKVDDYYAKAKREYYKLIKSNNKKKYRSNWMKVISMFEEVYKGYPKTSYAPKSLFMIGNLYTELSRYSYNKKDMNKAIEFYRLLVNSYPEDLLADDAQFLLSEILSERLGEKEKAYIEYSNEYSKVVEFFPSGDMVDKAKERLKLLKGYNLKPQEGLDNNTPEVISIRHWSNPNYTRIAIDLSDKVSYKPHLLKEDPSINKPPRLYIDLSPARLKNDLKEPIPVGDGFLKRVRVGQYKKDTVRVVLDLESLSDYKVFSLEDPYRVVIDIKGQIQSTIAKRDKTSPPSLVQELGLKIKRIVLDPGHGGKDPGAIGKGGLQEKEAALKIALQLKKRLLSKGYEVFMTREDDTFIPLEERTAFANTKEADLFVSIHVNASPRREAYGIETYYLNLTTDEESMRVAARENATSGKKMGDLQFILYDLMQTSKVNESKRLASLVQNSLVSSMSSRYSRINDLGVKHAPFYVLIGANMPSILVETSFISNSLEEERLRNPEYLEVISEGILKGIERYIESIGSVASG